MSLRPAPAPAPFAWYPIAPVEEDETVRPFVVPIPIPYPVPLPILFVPPPNADPAEIDLAVLGGGAILDFFAVPPNASGVGVGASRLRMVLAGTDREEGAGVARTVRLGWSGARPEAVVADCGVGPRPMRARYFVSLRGVARVGKQTSLFHSA